MKTKSWLFALSVVVVAGMANVVAAGPLSVHRGAAGLEFQLSGETAGMVLTVVGPNGAVERFELGAGGVGSFSLFEKDGALRADGTYRYEVVAAGKAVAVEGPSAEGRARGLGAAERGDVVSGAFTIRDGAFVLAGDQQEPPAAPKGRIEAQPIAGSVGDSDGNGLFDQVIPDDLIVQGSGCFGFDCVNNESFGFDTIRLKENNLRIKFEDTSTGTFPTNDWQLTANDSASGGASKFSIEDITGSRVPFTVTAGAATNSIFVDSTGRVGFRTSTPVLDLHVATSNTPALRLEQNNSGGFTAQTWDIAGNEANFFVRDVTSGSRLPFRIRPGAPTSALDISADGDVGIGTASPDQKLHVAGSTGTTQFLVQETSGTNANRVLMTLSNNGPVSTELVNTANSKTWRMNALNGGFAINLSSDGQGDNEFFMDDNGAVTILGTLTQGSDRNRKANIVPVNAHDLLAKVEQLPVSTWSWKEELGTRHLGPMAQDFSAAFGLGATDTGIAIGDMAGVSLAAVQALAERDRTKDAEITALKAQNAALEARLAALEAALAKLTGEN